ncbi:MAG: PDZ domain-containing protein [Myxococcota bacterium]
MFKAIVPRLIKDKAFVKAAIGIAFKPNDPKATAERGVVVDSVSENGAAAKAGLRAGDVIVSINDNAIKDGAALQHMLLAYSPGKRLPKGQA